MISIIKCHQMTKITKSNKYKKRIRMKFLEKLKEKEIEKMIKEIYYLI